MVRQSVRPIEILLVQSSASEVVLVREAMLLARIINNVRVVDDAELALSYLHRRGRFDNAPRPDLLLVDNALPGRSGLDLLAVLRDETEFACLPVAILSDCEDPGVIERARALRADWFITKPVDADHLIRVVCSSSRLGLCLVALPDAALPNDDRPLHDRAGAVH